MGYPDFLGIGARKAGTTWLYRNLRQHPQIWLPPVKEIHYLDHRPLWLLPRLLSRSSYIRHAREHLRDQLRALPRRGSAQELRWAARYYFRRRSDHWYRSLFPADGSRLTGEICPGYARVDAAAVAATARRIPHLKLVYLLRDPIECAWSSAAAHFEKKRGPRGLMSAPAAEVEYYLGKHNSVSHLRYADNLSTWERFFPAEQIFIGYFDELRSDPRGLFKRVLSFLGVDDSDACIAPDVERRFPDYRREIPPLPECQRRFLARLYGDSLAELHARLENEHTGRWLAEASRSLAA